MATKIPNDASYEIRHATLEDVNGIWIMQSDLAQFCGLSNRDHKVTRENIATIVDAPEQQACTWVAANCEVPNALIGFVIALPQLLPVRWNTGKGFLRIEDLFVEEYWRGKGVGRGLLGRCAQFAVKECGGVSMELDTSIVDNDMTLGAYEQLGFDRHDYDLRMPDVNVAQLAEWSQSGP